jgi:hypothetical protein
MRKLPYFAALAVAIGLIFLTLGYFWGKPGVDQRPFCSFLAINLGGLFVFTASYTFFSEHWLKEDFARTLSSSIDEKLRTIRLHQSITDSGLSEVFEHFNSEELLRRIESASEVSMIVMRSSSFFRANHANLRERLAAGTLRLQVCLPDPRAHDLMDLLCRRYSDHPTATALAHSLLQCVNVWLREQIWAKLTSAEERGRLIVRLHASCPLYSAYLFDNRELWYIPYQ